jgi:hypothetical protein
MRSILPLADVLQTQLLFLPLLIATVTLTSDSDASSTSTSSKDLIRQWLAPGNATLKTSPTPRVTRLATEKMEAEVDNDTIFYPLADDLNDGNTSANTKYKKKNMKFPVTGKRKDHNMEVLLDAIRQILHQLGFTPSDLRKALSTNSSLFANFSRTLGNTSSKGSTDKEHGKKDKKEYGGYSMPEYEKRMTDILRLRHEDEDAIKAEIQGFIRGNSENRTLLIKMIQLVAKKWGQGEGNLAPPFGTLNSSKPFHYPPGLRAEFYELAPLLTKDLRDPLFRMLAKNFKRKNKKLVKEMATLEEDSDGNRIFRMNRHAHHSQPQLQIFQQQHSGGPEHVYTTHAKHDGLEEVSVFHEGSWKKMKERKNLDISPSHLENIIRREHKEIQARRFMDVASAAVKHRNRMTRKLNLTERESGEKRL